MDQFFINHLPRFIRKRLEGRHTLQKSIGNTGWLFADQILRMGVGLFVGVWVARYLGAEQFGVFSYAIAFVALFSPIAALGLDNIVVREIVKYPESKNKILGTAFMLKFFGGALSLLLTISLISLIRPDDHLTRGMVGIIAAGTIFQTFDTIDLWFKSQVMSKYTIYAKNTAFIFASMGKVGLILIKAPLIAFAWIGLAEIAMGAAGLLIICQVNRCNLINWTVNFKQAKILMKNSWPLILSSLSVMMYMRIDQIMLGEMLGNEPVGIYSAAIRLSEIWYFIPTTITASVFPAIIEAKKNNTNYYYKHLRNLYNLMAWMAVAIAIPITFFAGPIISFIYGGGYKGAETVLAIHIWAGIFVFLGVASNQFLLAENYTKISLLRTVVGAAINIMLNLFFIPRYGVNGAAIATLISYFSATFFLVFVKKTQKQAIMMFKSLLLLPIRK